MEIETCVDEVPDEETSLSGKHTKSSREQKSFCLCSCYNLSQRVWANLILLVLCYTCVFASTTLMIGGAALATLSVGGDSSNAPVAQGVFFVGAAAVSIFTAPLFGRLGRRFGFAVGSCIGIVGGCIGMGGIFASSTALVILSAFPTGMATGVGLHLRFAAMEVVREEVKPFAMTLVLSGGCIAAFLGPESQLATTGIFGENLEYFGLFMMIVIFNAVGAILVLFVKFPAEEDDSTEDLETVEEDGVMRVDVKDREEKIEIVYTPFRSMFARTDILTSAALASFAWIIMSMPMSIFRVAMAALGYSTRLSLTTLELHFLGMYSPGFFAGSMIKKFGTEIISSWGSVLFAFGLLANLLSRGEENGTPASWIMGLIFLGVGWHLTFASATVMLAKTYEGTPHEARRVQSFNDIIMFGTSGSLNVATGYIYSAGRSDINGWRLVNFVVAGLLIANVKLLFFEKQRNKRINSVNEFTTT